jgi:hypothetical protein
MVTFSHLLRPHTTAAAMGVLLQAVSEVALCMMLMLSRRVDEARQAFQRRVIGEPSTSRTLFGKTLGIIGLGRVGTCLAAAAQGLGMKVGLNTTTLLVELVTYCMCHAILTCAQQLKHLITCLMLDVWLGCGHNSALFMIVQLIQRVHVDVFAAGDWRDFTIK